MYDELFKVTDEIDFIKLLEFIKQTLLFDSFLNFFIQRLWGH